MRISFLLTVCFLATGLRANNPDSLRQVLTQQLGAERLPTLLSLCEIEMRPRLSIAERTQYARELMVLAAAQQDTAAWVEACICAALSQTRNKESSGTADWLQRAGQLAEGHPEWMAKVLFWKGEFRIDDGQQDAAIAFYKEGLRLFEQHRLPPQYHIKLLGVLSRIYGNQNAESLVDSLGQLALSLCRTPRDSADAIRYQAVAQENLGHPDQALIAFLNAYRIEKRRGSLLLASHNLSQAASILRDQQRYEQAIQYYEESAQLARSIHYSAGLGGTYHSLAVLYKQTGQYEHALQYGRLALSIKQDLGRTKKIVTTAMIMAELYQITARYDSCMALCMAYLPPSETLKYDEATSKLAFLAAMAAAKTGQTELGRGFLKRGDLAAEKNISMEDRPTVFQLAAQSHALLGQYEKAYWYQLKYQHAQDSVFNIQKSRSIAETEARYETEKKEQQIAVLAKDNQLKTTRQYALLGILALVGLLAFALWRNARNRRRLNETLEKANVELTQKNHEVQTLLREIHHRVKNNLQIVSSLLRMQARRIQDKNALEALRTSQSRIRSMALLHQRLYQGDVLKDIPMRPYLNDLIQSLFDAYRVEEDRITLCTDLDDFSLNVDDAVPLGLIANELITNSLKYAFPQERTGEIAVVLKKSEQGFRFAVTDNGIGIPIIQGKPSSSSTSFGLELVESLAQKLNGRLSFSNEQGTTAELLVPAPSLSYN